MGLRKIKKELEEKQRLFQKALEDYKAALKAEIKQELKSEIMDDLQALGVLNKEELVDVEKLKEKKEPFECDEYVDPYR